MGQIAFILSLFIYVLKNISIFTKETSANKKFNLKIYFKTFYRKNTLEIRKTAIALLLHRADVFLLEKKNST